jgi:transcriptional regulator NrdR family protein
MSSIAWCEKCRTESEVYDTRKTPLGVHRRRKCPACGLRWTTLEIKDADAKKFFAMKKVWKDETS